MKIYAATRGYKTYLLTEDGELVYPLKCPADIEESGAKFFKSLSEKVRTSIALALLNSRCQSNAIVHDKWPEAIKKALEQKEGIVLRRIEDSADITLAELIKDDTNIHEQSKRAIQRYMKHDKMYKAVIAVLLLFIIALVALYVS